MSLVSVKGIDDGLIIEMCQEFEMVFALIKLAKQ